MFTCAGCNSEARDDIFKDFDIDCAGITETGYRKLGDRKGNWKCPTCKTNNNNSKLHVQPAPSSPTPVSLESIMLEIKKLSQNMASLSDLPQDIKIIKDEIQELKLSLEFTQDSVKVCNDQISDIDKRLKNVESSKEDSPVLHQRIEYLESALKQKDQMDRLSNVEVKGVPFKDS
ncbi:unnamed protein product [Chilo suppressalis]|uniref:Zinc finger PHD-type domain-containing protein n=1 Tax=Chilo suppressalis TaxID=168631 RepID=A0ABN8B4R6_CHISP|nr:unnamed protein product [Chilo suppressalis]